MSESLREPQKTPSDHCWTVLQDHGPANGGWGPAAVIVPWLSPTPHPFVYTGDAPHVIEWLKTACRRLAADSGKPTILVRYTQREDVFTVGGSS